MIFKDSAEINKKEKKQNHCNRSKTTVQNRLGVLFDRF
jgi:hypothetical protein